MIHREVLVPAPPEELWEALTDPDRAEDWLGGRIEWDLEEGAPLHFKPDQGEGMDGRVEEVHPARELRFSWWTPDGEASEVHYTLEPQEEGETLLTVEEAPLVWTSKDTAALDAYCLSRV